VSEFAYETRLPEPQLDLVRAALRIAAAFNPGLDLDAYAAEIELMSKALAQRAASAHSAQNILRSLNRYLFEELGFRGNSHDYEDPRNSYLNEVLDRRLGIPITLSVLYIEIGQRNGLVLDGIGYPGHFLVRWVSPEGLPVFLDPFYQGRVHAEEALLGALAAGGLAPQRARSLLAACTKRQILARMLQNLKASFLRRGVPDSALTASDLSLEMSPWDLDERRDHGLIAHAAGRHEVALADLETYLQYRSEAPDGHRIELRLASIRRELASRRSPPGGGEGH
jgi:regulator of sirC expression with transglutaminase-like and TPR domain